MLAALAGAGDPAMGSDEQGAPPDVPAGITGAVLGGVGGTPQGAGLLAGAGASLVPGLSIPAHREAPLPPAGQTDTLAPTGEVSTGLKEKLGKAMTKATGAGALMEAAPDMEASEDENATCGAWLFKESGSSCKVLFVPAGTRLNSTKLETLLLQWWQPEKELEKIRPDTMIASDAGTVHPMMFATPKLVQLPSFKQFLSDAKFHAERESKDEGFAQEVINDVIFLKLKTLFSFVLDAAKIANFWLVVDRVNAPSPAAELLIEAALVQTTSRPTILVIDSYDRLKKFTGPNGDGELSPETQKCLDKLKLVQAESVLLGSDVPPPEKAISQFYDILDFSHPEGNSTWVGTDDSYFKRDLPCPLNPAHLLVPGDPSSLPDRVKWQYHYMQTLFGGGSHYIYLQSKHDAPDLTSLGPTGFIAANGQGPMKPRLSRNIQAGQKLVMLHNTGGVTQAFAALRDGMLRRAEPKANELLSDIHPHMVSPAAWSKEFGLPEVEMMLELQKRAPLLLQTTVMAVDVMRDTSESILDNLTSCFSGSGGVPELGLGPAEEIAILTAWKRHMVLWSNGAKFERFADMLQICLYALSIFTTVLAVVYAMDTAEAEKQAALLAQANAFLEGDLPVAEDSAAARLLSEVASGDGLGNPIADAMAVRTPSDRAVIAGMTTLELVMVLLPIVATLLGTIRSKKRPREKWSTCVMAATQIIDQIYRYRLRVDMYDVNAPPQLDADGKPIEIPPKKKESMMRAKFVDTVKNIYTQAISTEVAKGGALKMNVAGYNLRLENEDDKRAFKRVLDGHVRAKLYREGAPSDAYRLKKLLTMLHRRLRNKSQISPAEMQDAADEAADLGYEDYDAPQQPAKQDEGDDEEEDHELIPPDDYVQQLTVASYVEHRVRKVTDLFERRAPTMSLRLNACEAVALAANTAGAVLAVQDMAQWVAITVSVASVAMALQDYFYMPGQLSEANRSVQETHKLLNHWDSLSLVQRKKRLEKKFAAVTSENCILQLCSARTGVSAALPGEEEDDEEK